MRAVNNKEWLRDAKSGLLVPSRAAVIRGYAGSINKKK
jgi:hypothetical protein